MLSVEEALAMVLQHARPLPPCVVPRALALGCVLAESVASDVDSPPHDKSIVDGYAMRSSDVAAGRHEFIIIEEVFAGQLPQLSVQSGQATRLMTGAPLPTGADCVVMFEQTTPLPAAPPADAATATAIGQSVHITANRVSLGQNIMRRGASIERGQTVLNAGQRVRPIEIGLLAEVGRTHLSVVSKPRVAVLATGNELVPSEQSPQPGQIRNSNGPMLSALAEQSGAEVIELGIGIDDEAALTSLVQQSLNADVLVISGGVSAGLLDLVPKVLADCGVRQVFHKVSLKPGKPLWFGVAERTDDAAALPTLVFGLPGNPVSTLVCFELFVRPALACLRGLPATGLPQTTAPLAADFTHRGYRPMYQPARWQGERIAPLEWRGSGDLRTLTDAEALVCFPAGDVEYGAGSTVDVLLLD